ncbi:hypothetical protein LUZ62_016460 [Rhynchospora pubera]|uniref:Thaumatin-like protein n=1 Tax=Rhynchospora pubera TaxID=906938 RepID=A0AAV8GFZ4_9POAL|nr:hypothetical protein LUZ62_016460 [Rhynchospora pubera]
MDTLLTVTSLLSVLLLSITKGVVSSTFTITNNCGYAVWPGLLSSAGTAPLETTGFVLNPGESRVVNAPAAWSGRIWGRTYCSNDDSGRFTCATGDCGSGTVECSGGGADPPASLAEFTLAGSGNNDFYDVSLVDGYNLPMVVIPQGGAGTNCAATGCLVDLNAACPTDLKVVTSGTGSDGVACKSACEAFQLPQYCCSGDYSNPSTCTPSSYSQFFKNACPRAYSYAYDDATSTFTCTTGTAAYQITFCPSTSSLKSSNINPTSTGLPLVNNSVVSLTGNGKATSHAIKINQLDISISVVLLLLTLITCLSTTLHEL